MKDGSMGKNRLTAGCLSRRSVLQIGALGIAASALPFKAFAEGKKLKVAAIFATPIEEP